MSMSMPVALLSWSAFLGLFHALSTGVAVTARYGMGYAQSPRDDQRPVEGAAARNARAFANFMETFPIFAAAVLAAHAYGHDHGIASFGAQLYFWARLFYVPAYVTGSKYRSAVWAISFLGIICVFLSIA